jgi:hypothetical protein
MVAVHFIPLPKFRASYEVSRQGKEKVVFTYEGPIPERLMDEYQKIVGNAQAKVSVTVDMGIKDFGSGISSMASVTLTCDQSEDGIQRANELARELATDFSKQNALRANQEFHQLKEILNPAPTGGPPFRG